MNHLYALCSRRLFCRAIITRKGVYTASELIAAAALRPRYIFIIVIKKVVFKFMILEIFRGFALVCHDAPPNNKLACAFHSLPFHRAFGTDSLRHYQPDRFRIGSPHSVCKTARERVNIGSAGKKKPVQRRL